MSEKQLNDICFEHSAVCAEKLLAHVRDLRAAIADAADSIDLWRNAALLTKQNQEMHEYADKLRGLLT